MSFEGIPYPEIVLRDVADTAMRNLYANPAVLDLMIAALPQRDQDSLRTAIKRRPIQTRIGYGLESLEDAQITVLTAGTMEMGRTLGDVVGETEEVPTFSTTLTADISPTAPLVLSLAAPAPGTLPLTGRLRLGGEEVAIYTRSGGALTLTARGVQHTDATWHYSGEAVVVHDLAVRVGWGESCDLRLDVLSSNPLLNMILAGTIKAALLLSAATFNDAGLTLRSIRETDLAPRPQAWPAELLNRTLLVSVQRDFALPEAFAALTRVDLEVQHP